MHVTTNHGTYEITDYQSFDRFLTENQDWPDIYKFVEYVYNGGFGTVLRSMLIQWMERAESYKNAQETGDWSSYQQEAADKNWDLSPQQTEALNNQISNQRTEEARTYETGMRDTSLISAADQLSKLGLSTSNVITTGGAGSNAVQAANVSNRNISGQMALAKYNQKMNMARSMIGMVGSMAAAGIHGGAMAAAKNASSVLATASAHSGLKALKSYTIAQAKKDFNLSDAGGSFAGDNSDFF